MDVLRFMIKEEKDFEINISEILWAFWKKLWCIILVALIFGGASYFHAKATAKPTYNAGAMLIINNKPDGRDYLSSDLINTSKELANTYTITKQTKNAPMTAHKTAGLAADGIYGSSGAEGVSTMLTEPTSIAPTITSGENSKILSAIFIAVALSL